MKLLDNINEALDHQDEDSADLTDEQLKQLKRAKTVFKALRKGKVTFNLASSFDEPDEHTVKYELGEPYYYWIHVSGTKTFRIEIQNITVHIDDREFYERSIDKKILQGSHKTMEWTLHHSIIAPRVRKRFENMGIEIRIADADFKIVYDEPQSINEDISSDDKKEKLIKRAKTIYKGLKTGVLGNAMFGKVHYILPDEFDVKIDIHNETFIEVGNNQNEKKVKLYYVNDNSGDVKEYNLNNADYRDFIIFLRKKFDPFGIFLWYDEKYENETLNEDVRSFKKPDPKEEKRVKTIFKALRKGVIEVQHPRTNEIIKFRYYINDPVFYRWEYYMNDMQLNMITCNFPGEGIIIYCDDEDVVDKCTNDIESISRNPTGIHLREMFINKLKNRFNNLDAKIHVNQRGMKFVLDEPKEETLNEELTDSELKKCKLIFNLYKKGVVMYNDRKYMYVLNKYRRIVSGKSVPDPIIEVEGNSYQNLSVYRIDDDGNKVYMHYDLHHTLNGHVRGYVKNKFANHGIWLSI